MTQKELLSLPAGTVVVHKKTGNAFIFRSVCKIWDGMPPNQHNERPCASCEMISGVEYAPIFCGVGRGPFFYFEAKEITLCRPS